MLISETAMICWNNKTKKHYKELGYVFTKLNDYFEVKIEDLMKGSHSLIKVLCDYCLETTIEKEYRNYVRDNLNSVVQKDCCAKCQPIKTKECNLINYGVESTTNLPKIKEKIAKSAMDKYGVDHVMKNKDIHDKLVKGYFLKSDEEKEAIVNKRKKTILDTYGVEKAMDIEGVKEKIINTNLERYGVKYTMQSEEVKSKVRKTMYKNGTTSCSRQQEYLWKLLGGELNYPVSRLSLDIAFPNDKIYLEYNGNGHELKVRMGNISKEEFNKKEIRRYQYLKYNGWKLICINSYCDYLPHDDILKIEFNKALEWFKLDDKGHWHYNINIGNKLDDPKYGRLRRIKAEDLEAVS